jgi:Lrp/AsnC family transcriptional regulator
MTEPLDDLDLRILKELQDDATLPLVTLASRVGSSKSVCWRRVQRFIDQKIITDRVAILNPKALGFGVMVLAFLKIDGRSGTPLSEFIDALRKLPQVLECHALMGDVDMMLKILVKDIEEYEHFLWNSLANVAGVQDIKSCISVTRLINTTKIPLEHLRKPKAARPAVRKRRVSKR